MDAPGEESTAVTDVAHAPVTTTPTAGASGVLAGPRLEQFEEEIRKLKVKGSRSEPERVLLILGILAVIAGFIVALVGLSGVRNASDALEQGDSLALTVLGVGIAVVGAVVWARHSLTRYLRYWLVRDLYEQRASTDRIVEAIEKQSPK